MRAGLFLSLALLAFSTPLYAQPTPSPSLRTISISGAANVKVRPDYVILTLGVETKHASLESAKAENDARVRRVLAFLRGSGVRPADIQTDYLSIEPSYD